MENSNTLSYQEQLAMGAEMNKRKHKEKENNAEEDTDIKDDGTYMAWRRKIVAANKKKIKKKIQEKTKEAVATPIKMGTSKLIKQAWIYFIPSFGLTLIWIDIHAFLRIVFPSFFCKLGEEWLPQQVLKRTGEAGKAFGQGSFIIEAMGLFALNLLVLIVIGFIFMILNFISNDFGLFDQIRLYLL